MEDNGCSTQCLEGTDDFIVGLCPSYWSYIPMVIEQIRRLHLINGINCAVTPNVSSQCSLGTGKIPMLSTQKETRSRSGNVAAITVSRCCIQGVLVTVDGSSCGFTSFLLDDGTGQIDCRYYDGSRLSFGDFCIPSLSDPYALNRIEPPWVEVGAIVKVFGKINCLNVSMEHTQEQIIREIDVVAIVPIGTNTGRAVSASLDEESNFWEDWCRIRQFYSRSDHHNKSEFSKTIFAMSATHTNAINWLEGGIRIQAFSRQNLPASDDTLGEWRVFGVECTCGNSNAKQKTAVRSVSTRQDIIKRKLLYCQCIATPELCDPNLIFRECLLFRLIEMERLKQCSSNHTNKSISCPHLLEISHPNETYLTFRYREDIANNIEIQTLATQVLLESSNPHTSITKDMLLLKTIGTLRQDGILWLIDVDSDTYLLISLEQVLIPYLRYIDCRDSLDIVTDKRRRTSLSTSKNYLWISHVTAARWELAKRHLANEKCHKVSSQDV